jgi:chemotaxis protein CheX
MHFSLDDIITIETEIWSSILDLEIRHASDAANILPGVRSMIGCIQITGPWEGAVTVHCPETLARKATGAMFEMPEEEVGAEEVQDALGELTNMTAGNVKTLLPEGCALSMPSVAEGTDYKLTVPGGEVQIQTCFMHADEPFLVTVIQRA